MPATMASCTASLELDRFRKAEASSVDATITVNYFDVRFKARQMQSHLDEVLEIRVVDRENRVRAKAIYEDISGPDFSLYLSRVVGKTSAPYRLDFWADHNRTAKYDGVEGGINEKDHAWRRILADPLPEDMRLVAGRYELDFLHDTVFVDIATDLAGNKISVADTLLPFRLEIVGAAAHAGKMIETRIVEKASGRLVGFHRRGRAKETSAVQVLGILDEETPYEVSVYVDADSNGKYDLADPSWRADWISNDVGIVARLDLASAPRAPIDTGER
jgi:hypothetical protein